MQVPISVAMNETKNHIIDEINKSGLPPCILETMLKSIYFDIADLAKKELEKDVLKVQENKEEIKDE